MMKENKTELEQKIDTAIELFRKDSNTTFLEQLNQLKQLYLVINILRNQFLNQKFCKKWLKNVQRL